MFRLLLYACCRMIQLSNEDTFVCFWQFPFPLVWQWGVRRKTLQNALKELAFNTLIAGVVNLKGWMSRLDEHGKVNGSFWSCPFNIFLKDVIVIFYSNSCCNHNLMTDSTSHQERDSTPKLSMKSTYYSNENVSRCVQHIHNKWLKCLLCFDQWRKHWFVLGDTSLRYYRDSEAEEVGPDMWHECNFWFVRIIPRC